ncbi:MAG: PfkB family carbohydrate kinase, partial [Acidobacteriota bacterium]
MAALTDPPTSERLHQIVDAMAGCPVALLVDLVLDHYITGEPKRISREAPVLILGRVSEELIPGGGANAVANIAALGGLPLPLGLVGDDDRGGDLCRLLEARGIPTDGIVRRADYRTPTKTRILAGGRHAIKQQIVRYDVDDVAALDDDGRADLLARLDRLADRLDRPIRAAVLSDYGCGAVDPALVPGLRQRLGPSGVLLGDSRHRLSAFQGLDGATPNLEEVETLLGRDLDDHADGLEQAGWSLRERLGLRFLLITRGS